MGGEESVDPRVIRFTHADISPRFRSGVSLDAAIEGILAGEMDIDSFEPIGAVGRRAAVQPLEPPVVCLPRAGEPRLSVRGRVTPPVVYDFEAPAVRRLWSKGRSGGEAEPQDDDALAELASPGVPKLARSFETRGCPGVWLVFVHVRSRHAHLQTISGALGAATRAANTEVHVRAAAPSGRNLPDDPEARACFAEIAECEAGWQLERALDALREAQLRGLRVAWPGAARDRRAGAGRHRRAGAGAPGCALERELRGSAGPGPPPPAGRDTAAAPKGTAQGRIRWPRMVGGTQGAFSGRLLGEDTKT
ncbi:unnamed protein product [Prorocentrum cordatum]|uniref:Uncharacterized protein n=1 Tax=Prorocentrum cordatum TaxID=2364126 RepID=A0ABN9W534_9DINO|nr:unnamed protein product [Polarella glacialis]